MSRYEKRDGICVSFYPLPNEQPKQEEIREKLGLDQTAEDHKHGIYIHIPFCEKICGFCPFNKIEWKEHIVARYLEALKKEMHMYSASVYAKSARFDSVYFGGGTPTALKADQIIDLLNEVKKCFSMEEDAVYFVEGSPLNYDKDKMQRLAAVGVNRISMGVQTFQEHLAKNIELPQTPGQSRQAIENAHTVKIKNVGIDLMYPLPGMCMQDWMESMETSIRLRVDHVCIIPFCILPHTPVDEKVKNNVLQAPAGQETEIEMYSAARRRLLEAGYEQYSIMDFALPGKTDKAALNYFGRQANLLAFGPAAYGYVNHYTYFNIGDLEQYMQMLEAGKFPVILGAFADLKEQMHGMMAKGLRMLKVDRKEFRERFGEDPMDVFGEKIGQLVKEGFLSVDDNYIFLTEKGQVWGNNVCKEFFSEESLKNQISRVDLAKGRSGRGHL